jgi:NAD(P) transhydrogenase subunit alpha
MLIAIPKETELNEKRVAATPETVKKLIAAGFAVQVQAGAGVSSHLADAEYTAAGASIAADAKSLLQNADLTLKVQKPSLQETDLLKEGSALIAFLQPALNPDLIKKLSSRKIVAFSMDAIPRIARAQKLDALSSQANISGYKAVLMAANALGRLMPMMMTAAGTVSPAKVLILGAGVAGLQAIATAKRLGAVVEAFDTRPAVKEQVESLGGRFIEFQAHENEREDKQGYAKEISKESQTKEIELIAKHAQAADIVITTAQIPGKKAPVLITEDTVRKMKPGSVIIDLAAETGGNCTATQPGEEVVKHGVTIVGRFNVPSLMPAQSAVLYARNIMNLVLEITKDGGLRLDPNNEIIRSALVTGTPA